MANEKRLISSDDLQKVIDDYPMPYWVKTMLRKRISELLPTEAAPVVHGRWEAIPDNRTFLRCSVCHDSHIYADWDYDSGPMWYYCPNCGAKMDGERKDNEED